MSLPSTPRTPRPVTISPAKKRPPPDKEHVLEALNQVTTGMRAKLGESLSSIQRLNAPFGQATTPSLEAFRAYALGDEAHQKGNDIPEAEDHYKRALELDPRLAMAWARLGVLKLNAGALSEAAENFTQAYQLSNNVSEREKLYIAGHYYSTVVGDLNKSIETLQVATQEYPLDVSNFINIGVLYVQNGDIEKGAAANRRALELQPENAVALENGLSFATQIGDTTEAEKYIAQAQHLGLSGTSSLVIESQYYASRSDWNNVQKITAETAGRPDQFTATSNWASFLPQLGQIQLARNHPPARLRSGGERQSTGRPGRRPAQSRQCWLDGRSLLRSGRGRQGSLEIG